MEQLVGGRRPQQRDVLRCRALSRVVPDHLLQHGGRRGVQGDEAGHALREAPCELEGEHAAPIVAADMGLRQPPSIEQRDEVAHQTLDAVVLDRRRGAGGAIPAQVGREGPQRGALQPLEQGSPCRGVVGEAVQQQQRRAFPLFQMMELEPIDVQRP